MTTEPDQTPELEGQIPPPPADDAPAMEHDRYWLKYVYQGDRQRQLTVRALATGCLIGGVMSISNLYVGLKIGWGLGVAIISTSQGLLTGQDAKKRGVGGEVVCSVW